jgi:hypothetical protein
VENSERMNVMGRTCGKSAVWLALITVFMLNGCAGTPYVDSRREAGQKEPVGPSSPDMVAICYSGYGSSAAEAMKLAESECAKTGRIPTLDHQDSWACTMTSPTRAFYRCVTKP